MSRSQDMSSSDNPESSGHAGELHLSGLVAATFTPMTQSGAVNLERIQPVTEFVLGQGVSALFVCGSTGECPSLSLAERMAVAETYIQAASGRVPVIVQVGHNSLSDARDLAAHAESVGADAIALVPPSYFPPSSLDALTSSMAQVAEAAPSTPLYYYHIPRLSGVGFRMVDLLEKAAASLPTFRGIKFSSFEFDDLIRCVQFDRGRYNILFGSDEMLLAGLAVGAAGAVGSTYNFMGPIYRAVIDAYQRGDMTEAQEQQHKAACMVHAILKHGGNNAIKASMAILGVDCGPPRLPLVALSDQEMIALLSDLERAAAVGEGNPA